MKAIDEATLSFNICSALQGRVHPSKAAFIISDIWGMTPMGREVLQALTDSRTRVNGSRILIDLLLEIEKRQAITFFEQGTPHVPSPSHVGRLLGIDDAMIHALHEEDLDGMIARAEAAWVPREG